MREIIAVHTANVVEETKRELVETTRVVSEVASVSPDPPNRLLMFIF